MIPANWQVNERTTFEFEVLDEDGRTTNMEYFMKHGEVDVFEGYGEAVLRKGGHLRSFLPSPKMSVAGASGSSRRPLWGFRRRKVSRRQIAMVSCRKFQARCLGKTVPSEAGA